MKEKKIVFILSIVAIITISGLIIFYLSPDAYNQQCINKAKATSDRLYSLEGSEEKFIANYNEGNLSGESLMLIEELKNVINQCPILESVTKEQTGINISILNI